MVTPYPPISDYALLSDCHSSALVSREGAIDWACLRRFDAPSVFGRLLDWDAGGHFALDVVGARRRRRRYIGASLVLETTVDGPSGTVRIIDAFSMHAGGARHPHNQLLRVVEGVAGTVDVDVVVRPRYDYGTLRPWLRHHADAGAYSAVGGETGLVLSSDVRLHADERAWCWTARCTVAAGERVRFSLVSREPHLLAPEPCPPDEIDARLEETLAWWRQWSGRTLAGGRHADHVQRSAVVLKGLTCAPTGAMVAAPTTSLPEHVGGERNWDYRYAWIRDSTLVLAAMDLVGHSEVGQGFRDFLLRTAAGNAADLHIMYGVDGRRWLPERELDLAGYRGSRPVRVGNGAFDQTQHDMYGQILAAANRWHRSHTPVDEAEWEFLRACVDRACEVWQEPDQGIWEFRGPPRHFVHSKAWLWVAVDRGIRLAEEAGFEAPSLDRWCEVREAVHAAVDEHGVRDGHFTMHFDTDEVDAALLELPMVGFVAPDDERMVATVDRIRRDLAVPPQGFIHRYRVDRADDGLAGDEGTFLMCTFWLVDVLAMQGRVDEAADLFERLIACSNDLGLFSEQHDAAGDELIGNFPQAFTHMALINSAHQLACAEADAGSGHDDAWTAEGHHVDERGL